MRVLMDRPKECETHAIFIRAFDSGGSGDNGMKPHNDDNVQLVVLNCAHLSETIIALMLQQHKYWFCTEDE